MRYLVLASDYDGTLAHDGVVRPETARAIDRLRASGRRLVLVTGRELRDLRQVCPYVDRFDAVVAENGALLYWPRTREEQALAEPPPPELGRELKRRGAEPLSEGRVIVATRTPYETDAVEVIRELGLEWQVIFNKGAVMLLPSGVNKQTGLAAALAELGLSLRNVVSVGDAENDHAMLAASECGVAVANALPALKERADLVTRAARGEGVEELIDRLLADDLRSVVVARHAVALGRRRDGSELRISPYGRRVLVAGPPGSGKTTAATAVVERLLGAGYQCCIIDPEGDYECFGGLASIGNAQRAPSIDEVVDLARNPQNSLAVNLLAVPLEDRPRFFAALLPRLQELRAHQGRPHWIVLDEAHHLLPREWQQASSTLPRDLGGLLMVTLHPEHLSPSVLMGVDLIVAVGEQPEETLKLLLDGRAPPRKEDPREVVVWSNGSLDVATLYPATNTHRRHRRKYAAGDLAGEAFVFRGPDGKLALRAQNLAIFLQMAEGVDDDTWRHHLQQHDYSRWFREVIKDDTLAQEARAVEDDPPESSRAAIRDAVEKRYTLPE